MKIALGGGASLFFRFIDGGGLAVCTRFRVQEE